jgi:hypothetical protein
MDFSSSHRFYSGFPASASIDADGFLSIDVSE